MKKAAAILFLILFLNSLPAIGREIHASSTATFTATELLCRPTDHSVTVNIVAAQNIEAYFQYGTSPGVYTAQTSTTTSPGGIPIQVVIDGLSANTQYYYRMVYRVVGTTDWVYRDEHSFHTQRPPGSTFTFTIISDSHMNGGGGTVSLYQQTLNNVLAEHPDFHLDLGDTFWMDGVTSSTTADQRYLQQRVYMGTISASVPIFVSPGNHDQEEAWHLDDIGNPATSPPVLSANARKTYFPNPVPDAFYSGNTDPYPYLNGDHLREDYYAWTWGDALFVVIDPYWYTTTKPYIGNAGGGETSDVGSGNRWDWTLGLQQYNWLKQTLEESNAKFKFVLDHHMLGGAEDYVRGGAGSANLVEWGGYNVDGTTWGFNTMRPGWGDVPIHQLMVANHVTAYFHGHDHLYAYEVRDGVVYQEVPSPSMPGSGLSSYYSDPYTIKVLPSPGHIRVTLTSTQATVDYVATASGTVSYSYTINANSGNNPPTATYTWSANGLGVSFDGSSSSDSDGTIISYAWNFGDTQTGSGVSPSHTYVSAGTYTVGLTVTDDDGATSYVKHDITVSPSNVPPTAAFTFSPSNPTTGTTITFTDRSWDSDGSIASWSWSFGDGGTSAGQNPTHQYLTAGTYTVTLTVTDNRGSKSSSSQTVMVTPSPTYALTISVNLTGAGTTNPSAGTYIYAAGSKVTITATAASGYAFVNWSGDASGTSPTTTVTMDSKKNIIANFKASTNLALKKTATADSSQWGYGPPYGNDGNPSTRWSAANRYLNHWWKVDLGATYRLTGTEVMWQFARNYKYKVEVSTDNISWTLVSDKTKNTGSAQTQKDSFTATARYVKITVTALPYYTWASFYEFRVFGN